MLMFATCHLPQQDTEAVIEAVESGLDPNLTDDVGQTLLNWAAAFGTNDMVQVCFHRDAPEGDDVTFEVDFP